MKRIIAAFAVLTVASLSAVGCGGDDDDSTGNTGGTSNTGGEPSSSDGGMPSVNVSCDATENGVCQNDMDCPFVVDGTARTKAQSCGTDCVLSGDTDENCARDCMLKDLEMSEDCAGCYGAFVNCTKENCLSVCISAPASDECAQCQVEKGCRGEFNDCSGLPPE